MYNLFLLPLYESNNKILYMDISNIIREHGETITSVAAKMGITQSSLSQSLARPSFSTLERIANVLNIETWQLLAPPSVIKELEQARKNRGMDFVAFMRINGKCYTPSTFDDLAAMVEILKQER